MRATQHPRQRGMGSKWRFQPSFSGGLLRNLPVAPPSPRRNAVTHFSFRKHGVQRKRTRLLSRPGSWASRPHRCFHAGKCFTALPSPQRHRERPPRPSRQGDVRFLSACIPWPFTTPPSRRKTVEGRSAGGRGEGPDAIFTVECVALGPPGLAERCISGPSQLRSVAVEVNESACCAKHLKAARAQRRRGRERRPFASPAGGRGQLSNCPLPCFTFVSP